MRILWVGNPPGVGSGYGEQASLFVPRLAGLGHELAVQCNWGLQGMTLEAGPFTYYPSDGQWGNRALGTYADHFQADRIVILCDAWLLRPDQWPDGVRAGVWTPVDHDRLPPAVLAVLRHEKVQPIAMSLFGERLMAEAGLDPLYIPLGVDRAVFYPRPDIRAAVRVELGVPQDAFLVGMVAANAGSPLLPRKAFPQAFMAFAAFADDHPDAWLYVHTQWEQPAATWGINMQTLASAAGLPPDRVMFPPTSFWQLGGPPALVSNLYQAFDVLLSPSMGEGFGVPIVEAQACGVPVITSNHSSMPELTCAGWPVGGDPWWDEYQQAFFVVPGIDSIRDALENAYAARDDLSLRAAAAAFADRYDADTIIRDYWRPALEHLGEPQPVASATITTDRKGVAA